MSMVENKNSLFLWVPIIMAFGAAAYFTFDFIPEPRFPFLIAALSGAIVILGRVPTILRAILIFMFGFCYAVGFTRAINTPHIPQTMRNIEISGTVSAIDYTYDKTRIYLDTQFGRVRVNITSPDIPNIGNTIAGHATLFRPNMPDAPGAFDYARWSYFNGLTATGYMNDYQITSHTIKYGMSEIRDKMHHRANSYLTDSLVLGYKNTIDKASAKIWSATGIAHVWSISGFHMTLVSGWLFAIFYLMFRLIAPITRRVPARVPATIAAWFGLVLYLFLSGISVATIRAFLMTTLLFAAVIIGRSAISMRNICIAMCVIFLINPHYVMQAGFQLSFAAIFGLVWFWNIAPMPRHKILRIPYAATMTAIIAGIFTAPFVAAHFYTVPTYGLIGNLVLLPIFSLAIMPLTMIGTIAATAGVHGPLILAHRIYDIAFLIATKISALPHSVIHTAQITNTVLTLTIVGIACIMFVKSRRRFINLVCGGAVLTLAFVIHITRPHPIFMMSANNELVAFDMDGHLASNKSRSANHYFTFDTWKEIAGYDTDTPNTRYKCNDGICMYTNNGITIAYVGKFVPLAANITRLCRDTNIDYIASYFYIDAPTCADKILRGAVIIYDNGDIEKSVTGRPWHIPQK